MSTCTYVYAYTCPKTDVHSKFREIFNSANYVQRLKKNFWKADYIYMLHHLTKYEQVLHGNLIPMVNFPSCHLTHTTVSMFNLLQHLPTIPSALRSELLNLRTILSPNCRISDLTRQPLHTSYHYQPETLMHIKKSQSNVNIITKQVK